MKAGSCIEGQPYECDTFLTAFAAPKSGDFPLAAERDTYWVKSDYLQQASIRSASPANTNLGHGSDHLAINSSMHILPLPAEGKSTEFQRRRSGDFVVSSAEAQPATIVKFGEPVAR